MKKTKDRTGRARVIMNTNTSFLDIDIHSNISRPSENQYRFLGIEGETITVPADRTILYTFNEK